MKDNKAAKMLEQYFGSRMYIAADGHISFSTPKPALEHTVNGDTFDFQFASILMRLAELEEIVTRKEDKVEAEIRKAENGNVRT